MKSLFSKQNAFLAILAALMMAAGPASAVSVYDPLTTAVTFTDVIAAIMAVAAIVATLYVSVRGVRSVLGFIRS